MDVTIAREVDRLESKLLVLATVGSAGPFIGLLGTVIGIMTSFQSIAASKNNQPRGGGPGYRRGAACDRHRPYRGPSPRPCSIVQLPRIPPR